MSINISKLLDLAYFHFKLKRYSLSRQLCEHVLVEVPGNLEALYLLAKTAHANGDFTEAVRFLEELLVHEQARNFLDDYYEAVCSGELYERGIAFFRRNLDKTPNDYLSNYYLGRIYLQLKDAEHAVEAFRNALKINPESAEAHDGLAEGLYHSDLVFEALAMSRRAVELAPFNYVFLNNLAGCLKNLGKSAEAATYYKLAIDVTPGNSRIHSNHLVNLLCSSRHSPEEIFAEHINWAKNCAKPLAVFQLPFVNDPLPGRPLTIGYVSSDFYCHPVAFFIEPILANHDRKHFNVILYSNCDKPDYITEQFKSFGYPWHDISKTSDKDVVELVRKDGVDILVDLGGHTRSNRLQVFAMKPSPVQVTWLGYAHSAALDTIDYRITDAVADPPGMTEHLHTETLWRLNDCFLCYRAPQNPPLVASAPNAGKGFITFGAFNHFAKITGHMLNLWAHILNKVNGSHIVIKSPAMRHKQLRESIYAFFNQAGISSERITMQDLLPTVLDHLSYISNVDIALDTYPYNGTTTTCESLFMGVPVISLAGRVHVSRVGASILNSVNLGELVAGSDEDYIGKACSLAGDHERLKEYRTTLRQKMQGSPLMDVEGFTRKLETAYHEMWRRWCENVSESTQGSKDKGTADAWPTNRTL